jgi:UDPglucose 6-dehydrogenase
MNCKFKITVVGTGYVGMSMAVLMAKEHDVIALDIDETRVSAINNGKSTVVDVEIQKRLDEENLSLRATLNLREAYENADFVVVATPTNYDPVTDYFDTSTVENVIGSVVETNSTALIIIKSTVPVGFTVSMRKKFGCERIIFSPEFLREGKALYDNLYPSRIIIGSSTLPAAKIFAGLLEGAAIKKDVVLLFMEATEAEAVKLFANNYLAMRVAFFNELDNYAISHDLISRQIIEGVSLDPRVGSGYNNPSFGYGGYCLPKDTKQLRTNFNGVPQALISAIVESNSIRKDFITKEILANKPQTIGVYRLVMKAGSDNYRSSAVQGIIERLKLAEVNVVIYEPLISDARFLDVEIINNLSLFKEACDIIIANRVADELIDVTHKIFTRDIFGEN